MKHFSSSKALFVCAMLAVTIHVKTQAQSIVASGYTFTAASKTYNYLSGGTSIPTIQTDDAYTTIPIGFTFKFCGINYNDVTVCSNGWLRFGSGIGTAVANWNYNAQVNSGIQPCVYALYEDVSGVGGTSTYLVSGSSPNRIFKWECRNWLWDYLGTSPCISFQVWLHEATGVVECIYQQEAGAVAINASGGATIGIANSSTDWQTLDNVSTSPTSSSTTYTYALTSRPASGQSYMWDPGAPCAAPTNLAITLLNSMYGAFSWNTAAASVGYEYVINQTASGPLVSDVPVATSNTFTSKGGLTPNTQYYIHVRNKCGTNNYSSWVTLPFTTLPACVIASPPGLLIPYVDSNSAIITWQPVTTVVEYEYIIKNHTTPPPSGTNGTATVSNQLNLSPLDAGKTYYVFLRVKCLGNDSSSWLLDSFYVPIPCRAPDVKFTDVNSSRIVAYWAHPLSAYEYEVVNSSAAITPVAGIKMVHNSYLFPFLDDDTKYYVYARSFCDDRGVRTVSGWSLATVNTWALSAGNLENDKPVLTVYPNPADDQLVITTGEKSINGKIIISDIAGKILIETTMNQQVQKIVKINALPTGMYILQYTDEQHSQQVKFNKL